MSDKVKYIYSDSLSALELEVESYIDNGFTPLNIIPGYPTSIWICGVYKGTGGGSSTIVDAGSASSGTITPLESTPLQSMTIGTAGGGPFSVELSSPSGTEPSTGTKTEIWITANDTTSLNISSYSIPSDSTLSSPLTLTSGETYILLVKKGLDSDWYLTSFVGGY